MKDTRALLNRIAEFRKRLDAMPRLIPAPPPNEPAATNTDTTKPTQHGPESGSRTQAILEQSLRQLAGSADSTRPELIDDARRLLIEARGLVSRMKALVDEPLLAGPPIGSEEVPGAADPLAVHFRETSAIIDAAVRYALTFPASAIEQSRLCEGLEGMIDAGRRRFEMLASALERRRLDEGRIDILATFLVAIEAGEGDVDAEPIIRLADALLSDEPGHPLRMISAHPKQSRAYLGGPEFPPVARFVAAHSLNCGCVLARIVHGDSECRELARELVIAGLLHDVGMLRIDASILSHAGPLNDDQKRLISAHTRTGAERITTRLPKLSFLADAAAYHHERADGSGFPAGLINEQVTWPVRLLAAVDAYSAMCAKRPHRPAFDPRTAMTEIQLMAERGRLDRDATAKLLSIGLYPSGTVVELSNGATGVVVSSPDPRSAYKSAAKPSVAMLTDRDGRPLATPRYLELTSPYTGNVVRALDRHDRLNRLGRSYPEWV